MTAVTRHTHQVVFGRIEAGCPRCVELLLGAPVRKGWGSRRQSAGETRRDLDAHFRSERHKAEIVCTFGDW